MPSNRKIVFANGEYYHVYNRGVEKRTAFTNKYEFLRAIDVLGFYRPSNLSIRYSKYINLNRDKKQEFLKELERFEKQVEVIAFCFMGNHFHFLLKQLKDNGIVKFMAKFTNSYTKYFNTKHQRVGPLFQGVFKAVHVESDEQLIHLSRYIHLNPVTGFLVKIGDLDNYPWSSYPEYLGMINRQLVHTDEILSFFKNIEKYQTFVTDQADYAKNLKIVEYLSID